MKRFTIFFLIFLAAQANFVHAETAVTDAVDGYDWKDKLKRGGVNIISSPVEIGRSIYVDSRDENLAYGWTVGLVKGLGMAVWRLGAGVVEVVTFPFDFPNENKAPILEPEYVWEKPGVKYA